MLPYTGTYAALGNAIENGFKLYVQEQGGKLGGRELEYYKVDDEYGTLEQIRAIKRRLPKTRLLELPNCGHSPHRDQPEALIEATSAFLGEAQRT